MKSNTVLIIWSVINTVLIGFLAMWINISLYIPQQLEKRVEKVEIEMETYKSMKSDSIFIQVDNHINIPKSIKIIK